MVYQHSLPFRRKEGKRNTRQADKFAELDANEKHKHSLSTSKAIRNHSVPLLLAVRMRCREKILSVSLWVRNIASTRNQIMGYNIYSHFYFSTCGISSTTLCWIGRRLRVKRRIPAEDSAICLKLVAATVAAYDFWEKPLQFIYPQSFSYMWGKFQMGL